MTCYENRYKSIYESVIEHLSDQLDGKGVKMIDIDKFELLMVAPKVVVSLQSLTVIQ